jgi:hypothetical protein
MDKTVDVELSPILPRTLAALAVVSVLATTTYAVFFSSVGSEFSALINSHNRAAAEYRIDRLAAFKATWKDKCALTPAGKIGHPGASNFNSFLPPSSLDLDFKDGAKAYYDLNDLKTVDCPQSPNA